MHPISVRGATNVLYNFCRMYVTAVAVGQRQRLRSGSGASTFAWFTVSLSSRTRARALLCNINITYTLLSGYRKQMKGGRSHWHCNCNIHHTVSTHTHASHISHPDSSGPPGVFCKCFYNHAHRLRLEKLLYIGLSRSPNGFFLVLLDPGGSFTSETAARRFQK
jgi:hypothetical protein